MMHISNDELKEHALNQLRNFNKWGESIGVIIVSIIIAGAASMIPFGGLVVNGPIALGLAGYFLRISRNGDSVFNNLFDGFQNFGNALIANLLSGLLIGLATLLLIVPGFIVGCGYSQINNIMHDNPQMSGTDAMNESWRLMDGHKMDYFILNLSFIGWAILCIFTIGIGFLFLAPYMAVTKAKFYDMISGHRDELVESIGADIEN
jgi:uncharacterized membrane protein